MICGRKDIVGIEIYDSEMVGAAGYDYRVLKAFDTYKISYIAKNTNANTITHYVSERSKGLKECIAQIRQEFPRAEISCREVAIIGVIGSNMKLPGFLYRAAKALAEAEINVLALDQCMRQVNMQFIIERKDFEKAHTALHYELVEKE
jgi:aspartate kinase